MAEIKKGTEVEIKHSSEIDFELQTLDVSALYGKDYVLCGNGIEVYGGEMTQLQRNATQDLRVEEQPEQAVQTTLDSVSAAQVSSLAALKEEKTGEETRELFDTKVLLNVAEQMQEMLMPDVGGIMDCSAVLPLHFDAGQDELRVQFKILDDDFSESDELFTFTLANLGSLETQKRVMRSLLYREKAQRIHWQKSVSAV